MSKLTHLDAEGRARMVDVSDKPATARTAIAEGLLVCTPATLALVRRLPEFVSLGQPALIGMSRKSTIAALTGRPDTDRLPGSLALAVMAAERGAHIIRAHDVAQTVDALKIAHAVQAGV